MKELFEAMFKLQQEVGGSVALVVNQRLADKDCGSFLWVGEVNGKTGNLTVEFTREFVQDALDPHAPLAELAYLIRREKNATETPESVLAANPSTPFGVWQPTGSND